MTQLMEQYNHALNDLLHGVPEQEVDGAKMTVLNIL